MKVMVCPVQRLDEEGSKVKLTAFAVIPSLKVCSFEGGVGPVKSMQQIRTHTNRGSIIHTLVEVLLYTHQ